MNRKVLFKIIGVVVLIALILFFCVKIGIIDAILAGTILTILSLLIYYLADTLKEPLNNICEKESTDNSESCAESQTHESDDKPVITEPVHMSKRTVNSEEDWYNIEWIKQNFENKLNQEIENKKEHYGRINLYTMKDNQDKLCCGFYWCTKFTNDGLKGGNDLCPLCLEIVFSKSINNNKDIVFVGLRFRQRDGFLVNNTFLYNHYGDITNKLNRKKHDPFDLVPVFSKDGNRSGINDTTYFFDPFDEGKEKRETCRNAKIDNYNGKMYCVWYYNILTEKPKTLTTKITKETFEKLNLKDTIISCLNKAIELFPVYNGK